MLGKESHRMLFYRLSLGPAGFLILSESFDAPLSCLWAGRSLGVAALDIVIFLSSEKRP